MVKEKRILSYLLGWLIIGYIILFIGTNNVFAATYDNFEVTWYYRNKSNESELLNVLKQEDVPLYASTNEYVNGYTTRIENNFIKDAQYYITYELMLSFSSEQELNYRSDTLERIKEYSYVDNDFKLLNVTAEETWNRPVSTGTTLLKIKVIMQILAINNTSAIRFGVYTNNNISIGFYNHTDYINYYLLDNINLNEDINNVIIDKNNQILEGQDQLKEDIGNMQESIIDSNKETQDVIKDQFNSCRDSYNLFDISKVPNTSNITNQGDNLLIIKSYSANTGKTLKELAPNLEVGKTYIIDLNTSNNGNQFIYLLGSNTVWSKNTTKTVNQADLDSIVIFYGTENLDIIVSNIQINKGSIVQHYEPYGKEICSNKIDETNDKLNGIQGALTDSSAPNTGALTNSAGWLPAGPLDSILNLPLTMLNSLTNSLEKTCSPLNLTLPYVNKNIQIPCLSSIFAQINGVKGLWAWVGTIASVLILYNYLLNLYAWVDRVLTLRAEFDEAMGADMANWGRL